MTGSLAYVDYLATTGGSVWHRASAVSKMLLVAVLLAIIVTERSPGRLGLLFALACALAWSARLPLRVVLVALGYPLVFSALFVLSHLDGTWTTPARLLLRAVTAGLSAMWLVGTTPMPDLLAPLSRVTPRVVGDGLFLTYRAFFSLVTRAEQLWRALRLRAGLRGDARHRLLCVPALVGAGLGTLVLHSFERSERLYGAMKLRGHAGRICGCRHYADWTRFDVLPLTLAALLGGAALFVRFRT